MQTCIKACEINGRRFSKSANLQAVEKYTSKQVQVKKGIRIAKNTPLIVLFIVNLIKLSQTVSDYDSYTIK